MKVAYEAAECEILRREPEAPYVEDAVLVVEVLQQKQSALLDRLFQQNRTKAVRSRPSRIWCL